MSFFKNFRNNNKNKNKKQNSINSQFNSTRSLDQQSNQSGKISKKLLNRRREEDTQSLTSLQRSETFTINEEENNLEKKSLTHKNSIKNLMFEKFSTFTRKKKISSTDDSKKWSDDEQYESAQSDTDPFNVLYKQPSNLKSGELNTVTSNNNTMSSVDFGTYKKNKATGYIRQQLEELKNKPDILNEMDNDTDENKYKTVTLNSFRKSFRDRFLNQEKENPSYNPAWFVEVDPIENSGQTKDKFENGVRPEVLVFENDNYRPSSKSPLRENRSPIRSPTSLRDLSADIGRGSPQSRGRTNLKRHETFKVERPEQPSIRIEIKNSITPNEPGRIVPVGVAKPFNSLGKTFIPNSTIPVSNTTSGYQTCIQITPDEKSKSVWVKSNTQGPAPKSLYSTNTGNLIQITSSNFNDSPYDEKRNYNKSNQITTNKIKTQTKSYFKDNQRTNQLTSSPSKIDLSGNRKRWTLPAKSASNINLYSGPVAVKPKTTFAGYLRSKWTKDSVPNYAKPTSSKLINTSQINNQRSVGRSKSPIKIPWR